MVFNPKQDEIIENINGIYVVDAGPGTGKTHTITKRYLNILNSANIDDILLLTFTKNAAENMKKKIFNKVISHDSTINLLDANISTFHSFCNQILRENPESAPYYLGINEPLSKNYSILESSILENYFFKSVYYDFKEKNLEKYPEIFKTVSKNYFEILFLIKKLLSKGIFPTKDGWFLDGEKRLIGDFDKLLEVSNTSNASCIGARGAIQSKMLKRFKNSGDKVYLDLPNDIEENKQISQKYIEESFNEDRDELISFIHDIYFSYIEKSVIENKLNFDFLIMFSYLMLYHDHKLRENNSFRYIMVDEFQDTNELQFILTLMLLKEPNLCAVGDWKQGIYGFRNATIDNILNFEEKLNEYKSMLNNDFERIKFDLNPENKEFLINFRSSQKILDFSNNSLIAKGSNSEEIDAEEILKDVTKLSANFDMKEYSEIEFITTKDKNSEIKSILSKISEIVNNENYKIVEYIDEKPVFRPIEYSDIAVLSRTRNFGLEVHKLAKKLGIPAKYDGGIELFNTRESVLILAWLRLLSNVNDKRAWVTILGEDNYPYLEKRKIIFEKEYPAKYLEFRKHLQDIQNNVIFLISKIFKHYNIDNDYSNAITSQISSLCSNNLISTKILANFIEEAIQNNETFELEIDSSPNSITIQTVHGSKGLEYPVVFIVNCNQRNFPSEMSEKGILTHSDLYGVRLSKIYGIKGEYHSLFNNWKADLLKSAVLREYDEERRLMFVAITRAKQYVYFTAYKPSNFFKELSEDFSISEPTEFEFSKIDANEEIQNTEFELENYDKQGNIYSVHDFIDFTPSEGGRGVEFGNYIHHIAEQYVLKKEVFDESKEVLEVKNFIDSLNALELIPEIECSLPVNGNLIRGIIDLIAIYNDRVEIIDYKTDVSKINHEEYRKQLSIYYYVVKEYFKKNTVCKIYYVSLGEVVEVDPIGYEELVGLMSKQF
ncbi:UvrD-helicase domain-containing protein [Methanococcus maripaludis]|uniref:DNA 3'-5' helicase n=1 Tax=Methanococcus maripaludis OS7 TaxID=637915 RepID=A0A2Z5PVG6_METMI|nr:UvrD-helicase domain-containing protein [Methanococcus maripaludis]BAP62901.1 putative ATP-dependent DNA helicase [Methanococcus maripaludis OS7]